MLLLCLDSVFWIGHVTIVDREREDTLLLLCVVDTSRRTQVKALEERQVQIDITESTPIGVTVIFVAAEATQWILTVGIATSQVGKLTARSIYRE